RPTTENRARAGVTGELLALALLRPLAETRLEPRHPATGVEDLLLTRVERVAGGADVGVDHAVLRGAASDERIPAGAGHLGDHVLRVDITLHLFCPNASCGRRVACGLGAADAHRREMRAREPVPPESGFQ